MDQFEDQPLEEYLNYARRHLLDLLQASYGNTEAWPLIRRRVLQIFGSSGFGRYTARDFKERDNGQRDRVSDHQRR